MGIAQIGHLNSVGHRLEFIGALGDHAVWDDDPFIQRPVYAHEQNCGEQQKQPDLFQEFFHIVLLRTGSR